MPQRSAMSGEISREYVIDPADARLAHTASARTAQVSSRHATTRFNPRHATTTALRPEKRIKKNTWQLRVLGVLRGRALYRLKSAMKQPTARVTGCGTGFPYTTAANASARSCTVA